MSQQIALLLFMVLIAVVLFLAMRKVVWWYFGIDKHIASQREIISVLKAQIELQQVLADQESRRRVELSTAKTAVQSGPPQNRAA